MANNKLNLGGQTFGSLTVVKESDYKIRNNVSWVCKCTCGEEVTVPGFLLKAGKQKSCGCLRTAPRLRISEGERFGHLVVSDSSQATHPKYLVEFRCDCGEKFTRRYHDIKSGRSDRCGTCRALQRKPPEKNPNSKYYGMEERTKNSYRSMLERCYHSNHHAYKNYGGRGIEVCDRWLKDPKTFQEDMGVRPAGTSLDRINNNLGYAPGNCRWASATQQIRNTRVNVNLCVGGRIACVTEWAEVIGVNPSNIFQRIKRNGKEATAAWLLERVRDSDGL